MYLPVDFATPMFYVAAAVVLALFAIPLGIGAVVRWLRFRADAVGLQTYARRRDLRIQSGLAIASLVLAPAALVAAAATWHDSRSNLATNVEARYNVSDVKMTSWNGSWAVVDLVDGTGLPVSGMDVVINDGYEPTLQIPKSVSEGGNGTAPSLDLR